jgi:spore photoproduct lyase
MTHKVLQKYKSAKVVECTHYKDIFSRYSNNYRAQKKAPKIILATKDENFLYEGSSLIQNQDQKNFYYTPMALNCIYDCHYCFLQGMYTSGYIVIFVNIDDFFDSVDKKLKEIDSMFLSISYDTDLMAMESATGICKEWIEYANTKNNLSVEIRTKSANFDKLSSIDISDNILFTWTLSPDEIIKKYEEKTPSLEKRVASLNQAIKKGCRVSIVIDPIIRIKDFELVYTKFFEYIASNIDTTKIESAIIGCFRMSNNYFKAIKKEVSSDLYFDSYETKGRIVSYSTKEETYYIEYVKELLKKNNIDTIYTT